MRIITICDVKIGSETPYLVMDERGMAMSTTELAENLATLYESPNNVLLVALAGEAIIGTASASSKKADGAYW